jgi:hypothetical protein
VWSITSSWHARDRSRIIDGVRRALLLQLITVAVLSGPASAQVVDDSGATWPITMAPIDHAPPPPTWTDEPAARAVPPTRSGKRIVALIDQIRASLTDSRYQPATQVRVKDGVYHWDCSGMAAWILRRTAPAALGTIGSARPVARDFAAVIARAPATRARGGWQRIDNIADVMPGDVFAWRRPDGLPPRKRKNTGHVGFVLEQPRPVPEIPGAWAVRIVDSTSSYHQDDTRSMDPDGGFGIGTLLFIADDSGRVTSYGWSGTRSAWYVLAPVMFGRVSQ